MLPNEIILYIISFLDNNVCCINSTLLHLCCVNRYFDKIIADNNIIKYHKFYKLNYNFLKINLICTRCDKLSDYEIKKLLNVYSNYDIYKNKKFKFDFGFLNGNKLDGFDEYLHFDKNEDLEKFIKSVKSNKKFTITFGHKCCGGKGCKVSL
tara:strand:- start:77 stop:532 length:456 start_codon:yes stop_codon:yes gene_type:complete